MIMARTRKRGTFGNVRALPSGRFQARYRDPFGQRHTAPTTFLTRGDADGWLATVHADIIRGQWLPESKVTTTRTTLRDYSSTWLANRDLRPKTATEYRRLLDCHVLPTFGDQPLGAIGSEQVRAWYAGMAKRPTQQARAYGLLAAILRTAVTDDLLPATPCRIRGGAKVKRSRTIRPATPAELATMAAAMPAQYRMLLLVCAWGSLRFGEAAELRRRDVDAKDGVVRIRRGVVRVKGQAIVGAPKTAAGVRDVHLPPFLLAPLAEHLLAYAQPGRDGLLFPSETGEQLATSTLYGAWWEARKAAGREDLTWHGLRHTGATLAAQSGASVRELMARLGHETPAMAMHYTHAAAEADKALAERMGRLVQAAGS
jgi:integrase